MHPSILFSKWKNCVSLYSGSEPVADFGEAGEPGLRSRSMVELSPNGSIDGVLFVFVGRDPFSGWFEGKPTGNHQLLGLPYFESTFVFVFLLGKRKPSCHFGECAVLRPQSNSQPKCVHVNLERGFQLLRLVTSPPIGALESWFGAGGSPETLWG